MVVRGIRGSFRSIQHDWASRKLAYDEARNPGLSRFVRVVVDPIIANQGICHADDLTTERGVGRDLLVADHRRGKDHFTLRIDRAAPTLCHEIPAHLPTPVPRIPAARTSHADHLPRKKGGLPRTVPLVSTHKVIFARPRNSMPSSGVFAARDASRSGLERQVSLGSKTTISAGAPGFRVPAPSPQSRAGMTADDHLAERHFPARTSAIMIGKANSLPTSPKAAFRKNFPAFRSAVRRVVGGQDVDGTLLQRLQQPARVAAGAQQGGFTLVSGWAVGATRPTGSSHWQADDSPLPTRPSL